MPDAQYITLINQAVEPVSRRHDISIWTCRYPRDIVENSGDRATGLQLPGAGPIQLRGERHPEVVGSTTAWVRDYRVLIPFLGPPGHFAQLSYVDVLRGDVSPAAIRGKWILVGATATGLTVLGGNGKSDPRWLWDLE